MSNEKVIYEEGENSLKIYTSKVLINAQGFINITGTTGECADMILSLKPEGDPNRIEIGDFDKISFFACNISWENNIVFGNTLLFENCSFENDIVIGNGNDNLNYKITNHTNSFLELTGRNSILFKNIDIIISEQGQKRIFIKHIKDEEVYLNNSSIKQIDGKIKLLNVAIRAFNIGSKKGCIIEEFTSENNLKLYKLNILNGDIFSRDVNNKMILSGINVDKIVIVDFFLNLDIKDVNLYNTNIIFDGARASLNIGSDLKSIATVWNPFKITYRGFCPDKKVQKDLKEIDILAAQEFFSEMKKYFSNKGNSIVASYFYSAEMSAHKAYLNKKFSFKLHHELIIASIAGWSSDFSQNWFKASMWYFSAGSLFGFIFVCLDSHNAGCLRDVDSFLRYYADIYSPLTIKFENIEKYVCVSGGATFLWMLWKIMASYLIYQMIVSSRKFVRF